MKMILQKFSLKKLVFIFYILLILPKGFGDRVIIDKIVLSLTMPWSLFFSTEDKEKLSNPYNPTNFTAPEYVNYSQFPWRNDRHPDLPFYLPYKVDILLMGIIPLSYAQRIVYLIKEIAWKMQGKVPEPQAWYRRFPPIMLPGHYLLQFIDSVKIRE